MAKRCTLDENLVGRLGPPEAFAELIVSVDVLDDRLAEFGHRSMRSALKRLLRQQAEEALHQVQPRRVRRGEVEHEARMTE